MRHHLQRSEEQEVLFNGEYVELQVVLGTETNPLANEFYVARVVEVAAVHEHVAAGGRNEALVVKKETWCVVDIGFINNAGKVKEMKRVKNRSIL